MAPKKKHAKGFQPKPRSIDEVNNEYNHHAVQHGHNGKIIHQLGQELERLYKVQAEHVESLIRLSKEAAALPKPAPTPAQPQSPVVA